MTRWWKRNSDSYPISFFFQEHKVKKKINFKIRIIFFYEWVLVVCRLLTLSTLFLGNSRHLINLHSIRKRSKLYENHMASPVCREKPDLTPSVLQNGWVPILGLISARPMIHFHCPSTQKKALSIRMQLSLGKEGVVAGNTWREGWGWDHCNAHPGHS